MILGAVSLALAEIASAEQRSVAILPELRIAQGKGVQITHHTSGYELWLSGNVDYAVIEYEEDEDNKGKSESHANSLCESLNCLQIACLPPVDPETMHSLFQRVTSSLLKPKGKVSIVL